MEGLWKRLVDVQHYRTAVEALAVLDLAKRSIVESRLRLIGIKFDEQFDDLFLSDAGTVSELAFNYISFAQYCKVIGLGPQLDFLRRLKTTTVADILEQFTQQLPPTEIKLSVGKERHANSVLPGAEQQLYVIKSVTVKGQAKRNTTEAWLYWLSQFESYGWKPAQDLLLQGDYLCAAMYDPRLRIELNASSPCLGFLIGSSESGNAPERISAIVYWPNEQVWLPVNEPTLGKLLSQGLSEALLGNIGMFGPLSGFRDGLPASMLKPTLAAQSTMSVDNVAAYALLKSGGLDMTTGAGVIGSELRESKYLFNLNLLLRAAKPILERLTIEPTTALPELIQLGWALWK